jgi:uncharacterized membrane protein
LLTLPARMSTHGSQPRRLQALDAARGAAMLFVCISHFGWVYFGRLPEHAFEMATLQRVGMVASPTFIMISGVLLGFLARTRPLEFAALRTKLVDRGLFMLTIGHVVIAVAHAPVAGGIGPAFEWGFITDVIAVGLMIGPWLVTRVPPGSRLVLAGAAYALTWITVALWQPESPALERAKEYLLGPSHFLDGGNPRLVFECFPLVPWLAVYVAATVLGEYLGRRSAAGRGGETIPILVRVAVGCVLGVLVVKGVPFVLKISALAPTTVLVWTLGWPFQKQPPSPAYLGVYAAFGLLLVCGLFALDARAALRSWIAVLATLGRASLAVFLVQYYLYFTLLAWWNPHYSAFWPLLLLGSLTIVVGVGLLWGRIGNNDLFSVGYRRLAAVSSTAASARF